MKLHKVSRMLRKLVSVVLIILLVAGVVPFSATPAAIVKAATNTSLPTDQTQAAQAAALGMSTEQPKRYAPDGTEINKKESPLGRNTVIFNKIYQMALTEGANGTNTLQVYNDFLITKPTLTDLEQAGSTSKVTTNGGLAGTRTDNTPWSPVQQEPVGVDIDGDGLQELVTIGLVKINDTSAKLQCFVSDYNSLTGDPKRARRSEIYTLVPSAAFDMKNIENTTRLLQAVAVDLDHDGKDEVVLHAGGTLYAFNVNFSRVSNLSSRGTIFEEGYFGNRKGWAVSDMEVADVDKDGYPDLIVSLDAWEGAPFTFWGAVFIYSGTKDLSTPTAKVNLVANDLMGNARSLRKLTTIDAGDIYATGENVIVVGGITADTTEGLQIITILYDPATKTYKPLQHYSLYDATAKQPKSTWIQDKYDLRCVALRTLTPGVGEDVVFNGFIFRYNADTGLFNLVTIAKTTNSTGYTNNTPEIAHHNITNFNPNEDKVWVFKTLVGNFDGNLEGTEQIIMLYYTDWHSSETVYYAGASQTTAGVIAYQNKLWKKGEGSYSHPSICPIYALDRGVTMEFLPERSTFGFSDPIITAVLAAPPYYEELLDNYPTFGAWTIYGTSTEDGTTEGNSVSVSVGRAIGFEQQAGIFGIDLLGGGWEVAMSNSFTYNWSTSTSISKSISFINYATYDQVALLVVPYDFYYFKATSKETRDPETGLPTERTIVVQVPYAPITTMMPISTYNEKAASMPNAPIITDDVLKHTVGDPRSYPRSATNITNVPDDGVLMAATQENAAFTSCGIGDGSIDQTIASSVAKDSGYDFGISVEASCYLMAAGLKVTLSGSAEYSRSVSFSSSKSTTRSGVVASVPLEYEQYKFNWGLVVYNYELPAGEGTQRFPVVNYMVKYDGEAPPYVPSNVRLDSQDVGENTIKWDAVPGSGIRYRVAQATSESGPYVELTGASGQTGRTYKATNLAQNQTYYYQVWAFNGSKSSKMSAPLAATTVHVTGMTVATQPRLIYEEGDPLDLSAMVLALNLSNGTTKLEPFAPEATPNVSPFTTSLAEGVALVAAQNGTPITVRHTVYDVSANTGNLTITAMSPYDFGIATMFKVGSTDNATALSGGQNLHATVNLTNKTATTRDVIIVLALYTDKGTMVQMAHDSKRVVAGGDETATLELALPSNISGHTAKVFAWDGTSFSTTTVTPMTPVIRLPE